MSRFDIDPDGQFRAAVLSGRRGNVVGLFALYALVGGAISLLGWISDTPRLADWDGDGISILPNAAVAAIIAAAAVLLSRYFYLTVVLGVFVALVGLTTLFQIATGIDLGIDTPLLFGRTWGGLGVVSPGRMGLPAATSWSFIGTALVLLGFAGRAARDLSYGLRRGAVYFAMIPLTISSLSIAGYIFEAEALYALPQVTVIALQTATFILAISTAIILSIRDVGPMRLLSDTGTAGTLFRRVAPAIVILPITFTLLQLAGERAGWYDRAFGLAAITLAEIALLLFLLLWTGRTVVDSEARKTAMFETALDCIVSIDHNGIVVEFNPAAEQIFGYRREEAIGRELAELIIPPSLREAHRRGLAHYLGTGEGPVLDKRIEVSAIRSDGTEFPVELAITRIAVAGPPQFTAYLRDITDRKASEQALLTAKEVLEERVVERTAELREANTALQRSNSELEQFASVASHDLQEPLRKIQAFGDRLVKKYSEVLGDQGRTYVERMDYAATRMRGLIESLLTFSRVTTKAEPFVPVKLTKIVDDVVNDLEARVVSTNGRVDVGDLPVIDADPVQMTQLFQNLIANGLKFHREGVPPVVTVSDHLGNDGFCEIAVADNGIGFEEEYLDRIFEVFQRLHARADYEGTGIGLAICRKIVERHGGTITATSSLDIGSTFLVRLPIKHVEGDREGTRQK